MTAHASTQTPEQQNRHRKIEEFLLTNTKCKIQKPKPIILKSSKEKAKIGGIIWSRKQNKTQKLKSNFCSDGLLSVVFVVDWPGSNYERKKNLTLDDFNLGKMPILRRRGDPQQQKAESSDANSQNIEVFRNDQFG